MATNIKFKYDDDGSYEWVVKNLHKRGIYEEDLGKIAYEIQHKYEPSVKLEEFIAEVVNVMHKRDFLNAAMLAINVDDLASEGKIKGPLLQILQEDAGVFGVDEQLAVGVAQLYGLIGVTNFGRLDAEKPGVIAKLDNKPDAITVMTDDIVSAIVAMVCGKIAHKYA